MIDRFARAAFFALLPAIAVGGALGFPVLLTLAGAAAIRPSLLRQAIEKPPIPAVLLVLLTALSALSSAWSPEDSAVQALQISIMTAAGLMFVAAGSDSQGQRVTRAGAVAGFFVLFALLTIEAIWTLPMNRAAQPNQPVDELLRNVARGSVVLLALTWTTVGMLLAHRKLFWTVMALLATAASGYISLQFGQFANTLAFGVGLIVFAVAFALPRVTIIAVSAGLSLWALAAPFLTTQLAANLDLDAMPRSWAERIRIWTYACDRIAEQPWFGHGLDAARAPLHEPIPVHPHSASLHIWFDTGVVGAVLAAALLLVGGLALARRNGGDRITAAATAATLASLGVIANVSYSLWAEWWICTMFIVAAIVGAMAPGGARR